MAGVRQCHRLDGSARTTTRPYRLKMAFTRAKSSPVFGSMRRDDTRRCRPGAPGSAKRSFISRAQIFSRTFAETHLMSLNLRWVGELYLDRVADTRVLCYAHSRRTCGVAEYITIRAARGRGIICWRSAMEERWDGDEFALNMWVRGSAVSCQAWRMWDD